MIHIFFIIKLYKNIKLFTKYYYLKNKFIKFFLNFIYKFYIILIIINI